MIRRQLHIYVSLLAVCLLCGFIAQAAAGDNHLQSSTAGKKMTAKRPSGQFSVSGQFSGELSGFITIGGKKVFISKTTAISSVGSGKIEKGTRLSNVFVYASGAVRRGTPTASLVLVRFNSSVGEQAMIRSNKDNKYMIPSRNNPRVGELKEGTPE